MQTSPFQTRRRPLFPQGPLVSVVGFGTYRLNLRDSLGREALKKALLEGVNLIDTASNYGFGQSELLIGSVLEELIQEKKLIRADVVLVSKAGYIQGPALELASAREWAKNPFPHVYQFTEELWYCMSPEFLKDQIDRSLSRMGVTYLNTFLIHNPEYVLKALQKEHHNEELARNLFFEQLKESFNFLETLAQEGKIKSFGISSNILGLPDSDGISLSSLLALGHYPHFKVIECPLNWLEIAPLFYDSEGGQSVINLAQEKGIGVLINRPFNAMWEGALLRLTSPPQVTNELEATWKKLSDDLERLSKSKLEMNPGFEDAPLSQLVLSLLCSIQDVSSVLCGMRKPHYVDDVRDALRRPFLLNARTLLYEIFESIELERDSSEMTTMVE